MIDIPLAGVEAIVPDHVIFEYSDWFTGNYQDRIEKLFTKLNGFRTFFIRLDNQINFSIFRECKSYNDDIVVGKDNWLFEKAYINDINNDNQVDISVLESRFVDIKHLQELLTSRGIYFILLISPSKAAVYGEYIPERYLKNSLVRNSVNYSNAKSLINTYGINCIDGHEFFMKNKESSPYDLFVRGGTHWSYYGASLFSMELISRIKKDTGLPIGWISCEPIRVDFLPWGTDLDIASLMNIFNLKPTYGKTAHPTVKAHFPDKAILPNVLVVGDSFMHTINEIVCDRLFNLRDFFYYYQRNIPNPFSKDREKIPKNSQLKDAILNKKIIIVEANEGGLHGIGFHFIQDAVRVLSPTTNECLPDSESGSKLTQTQISQLYISILGRASEGEGNAYWRANQKDMSTAADTMMATKAAKNYFGTTLNDNQLFIEHIYKNTLGKTYADDPDGINYWVGQLSSGKSKGKVVVAIINAIMDNKYKRLAIQKQFINRVAVSNYTADTIVRCPEINDLTMFTRFVSGVTDDLATVQTAKAAVLKISRSLKYSERNKAGL